MRNCQIHSKVLQMQQHEKVFVEINYVRLLVCTKNFIIPQNASKVTQLTLVVRYLIKTELQDKVFLASCVPVPVKNIALITVVRLALKILLLFSTAQFAL